MKNIFKQNINHGVFSWDQLGDLKDGRSKLGDKMPVLIYRLMQFTLLDVMNKKYGREEANDLLREAGRLAGGEFVRNLLDTSVGFNEFIYDLQNALEEYKVGLLRIEATNEDASNITLTFGEDLDCSGLPISGETVCDYDEGFFAGILEAYAGVAYNVKEIDCWADGDRICRFNCVADRRSELL